MMVGRHVDDVTHRLLHPPDSICLIVRCLCHDIQIIVFQEITESLSGTRQLSALFIAEGINTDKDNRTLPTLLFVIDPTNHGNDTIDKDTVIHTVLPMERDGLRIVLLEERHRMHQWVGITEESPHPLLLFFVNMGETLLLHSAVFLHHGFRHDKLLHTILTRILEGLLADHPMGSHRIGNLEGRIHQDTVIAIQLFGIHATHRGTYNQVGLVLLHLLLQQGDSSMRVDRQIVGNGICLGQHHAETGYRATLC